MKTLMLYSFIRYLPYFESGEFVNVGLIACEPQKKKLAYRLVNKNDVRVNHFFRNSKIFHSVRHVIDEQLEYIQNKINLTAFSTTQEMVDFFHHYTERRDGIFQFSDTAVALTENPDILFRQIYEKFIKFGNVGNEDQENKIIKQYRALFKAENDPLLENYKQQRVQGETSKFTLPLALKNTGDNRILKGIKSLAFDQIETPSMIEHCDSWVAKINRANDEGLLDKDDILFALDTADTASKNDILNTIKRTFDDNKIPHTNWRNNQEIIRFARDIRIN
ncbi:hypothetical protein A1D23_04610 [Chelonobacter oris]|uniref:DUF3037 domain-containing protein n=1 Tax=Chelonobacter oris TaxID=505317 RepID=UPI00244C9B12|nr:DUF3037 domain-containing protein [Chelonobacter oris]MDH2999384.1 hypothetical protein [Chelonobacter oris]